VGKVAAALSATPTAYLRKEMRFRQLAVLQVATSLTMTIVGPLMAWHGYRVWAIVGEQVSGITVAALLVWTVIRPWSPEWRFDWALTKWYLGYGKFVFVTEGLDRVISEFDDFWVGAVLGSQPLGYYSKAYEFANYPRRVVSEPIAQVLFPAFAKVQDDPLLLSKAYYRSSSLIVRVGFLVGGALVLGAPDFVVVFLGSKWIPMVPTFQLMMFYVLLEPLRAISGDLVNAVGHPQFYSRARVAESLLSIPLVILGATLWGVLGVAVALDVVLVVGLGIILYQIRHLVRVSLVRMLSFPMIALTAAVLVGWQVSATMNRAPLAQLTVKTLTFGTAYAVVLWLFEGEEYTAYAKRFARLLKEPSDDTSE
jgi:O-antigen/teichoic acid export membrane protein